MRSLLLEQVREHAGHHHDVEGVVLVGEAVLARPMSARGVIARVEQVGAREAEALAVVVQLAPPDADRVDVEAGVGAALIEEARERAGHAPDPAADVEHGVVGLEPGELHEVAEELVAGGREVAVADELQAARRDERIALEEVVHAELDRRQRTHAPYPMDR